MPDIVVENGYETNKVPDLFAMDYATTLKNGITDPNVLGLEQRLSVLGYPITTCNQTFDDETVKAVAVFQQDAGLKQTGIADSATMKAIDQKIIEYTSQKVYVDNQLSKAISVISNNIDK
ncbi:hypothetical protein SDC9_204670 [bioreactor metagenome]|uniref:Peptidoglycan binding-like domain-containing protein n=1 Tax=bioreactor metagenome TaxID=1076179 RepID=A0A645J0K0_9ZZZZ